MIVVGSVGSGKSSLLAALLGEIPAVPAAQLSNGDDGATATRDNIDAPGSSSSSVTVRGSIGYTQQDPFIQNATVRDNILMGAPLDEARYGDVLDACALRPDLDMLPAGKCGGERSTLRQLF